MTAVPVFFGMKILICQVTLFTNMEKNYPFGSKSAIGKWSLRTLDRKIWRLGDHFFISTLKLYLTSAEYNLYETFTGKEALDVIKRKEIHLVLLDIMMPRMAGICGAFLIIYSTIFINMHSRAPGYIWIWNGGMTRSAWSSATPRAFDRGQSDRTYGRSVLAGCRWRSL